jgi:hypothetical protein
VGPLKYWVSMLTSDWLAYLPSILKKGTLTWLHKCSSAPWFFFGFFLSSCSEIQVSLYSDVIAMACL